MLSTDSNDRYSTVRQVTKVPRSVPTRLGLDQVVGVALDVGATPTGSACRAQQVTPRRRRRPPSSGSPSTLSALGFARSARSATARVRFATRIALMARASGWCVRVGVDTAEVVRHGPPLLGAVDDGGGWAVLDDPGKGAAERQRSPRRLASMRFGVEEGAGPGGTPRIANAPRPRRGSHGRRGHGPWSGQPVAAARLVPGQGSPARRRAGRPRPRQCRNSGRRCPRTRGGAGEEALRSGPSAGNAGAAHQPRIHRPAQRWRRPARRTAARFRWGRGTSCTSPAPPPAASKAGCGEQRTRGRPASPRRADAGRPAGRR